MARFLVEDSCLYFLNNLKYRGKESKVMKKNNINNQTKENATAKVKTFFAILAKMEWYSFILLGPSLVMLGVVVNCVYLLASGACPDMGRAIEGIVLFGLLSFAFAFGGFVMAGDEWDDAKKEVLIKSK